MTKEQFMQRLAEGLADFDQESRDDILADFSAHFALAGSQGKNEVQICQELGDPDQIASSYFGDLDGGRKGYSLNWLALTAALLLNLFLALPVCLSLLALLLSLYLAALAIFLAALLLLVSAFWQQAPASLILACSAWLY